MAEMMLGTALARRGKIEEAVPFAERAVALYRGSSHMRLLVTALVSLAQVRLAAGDLDRAEADAESAARLAIEMAPPVRPFALGVLVAAKLARNDHASALSLAEEAMAALAGPVEHGEALVRLGWARALDAAGDAARARVAIAEARDRLRERASRIADPGLRRSFLERVPENARTLELAVAWLGAP
jgi:hypothetical protein